jgi:hypothetical protein
MILTEGKFQSELVVAGSRSINFESELPENIKYPHG